MPTTRMLAILTAVPLAVVLAGCASDAPEPPLADCASVATADATADPTERFPDSPDAVFTASSTVLVDGDAIVWIDVTPTGYLGYDQLAFLYGCEPEPTLLAAYVPANGSYAMLFTTDEVSDPATLPATLTP